MQFRVLFISFLFLTWCEATAQENEILNDSVRKLDEVIIKANTILGNKFVAKNRTGASYFYPTKNLKVLDISTSTEP